MTLRLPLIVSRARLLPCLALLVAANACAAQQHVDSDAWLKDVAWLADDARQGRDTDSPQLLETANWVAERFAAAGLQPLGDDGGWLQHYQVAGRRRLTEGNELRVSFAVQTTGSEAVTADVALALNKDWVPLQSALNGEASGPMVFAGYGIVDPDTGWNDYDGLDVKGKVVVVFRHGPQSGEFAAKYGERSGRERTSFVAKVNNAFQRGASALLVVNDPLSTPEGSEKDVVMGYRSLSGGGGIAASLPAANLTAAAGARFLPGMSSLESLQRRVDERKPIDPTHGPCTLKVASELPKIDAVNVLGLIPGNDPALKDEWVLIGAHMDHLGVGAHGSSRGGADAVGQIHNGADDNASGTAGVVELASVLAGQRDSLRRSVVLAAWSGEERGLLGSRHFAEQPPLPLDNLAAAVNMDMIGRSKNGYLVVEGMGTSPGFKDLVVGAHDALDLKLDLHLADAPSNNSDHASFFEKKVPVINFFTGLHDDYHMPSDDVDKIDAKDGAAIASLAGEVVRSLSRLDGRPPFTEPAQSGGDSVAAAHAALPAAGDGDKGRAAPTAYGVVLGTSPDMGYQEGDGVRISGVRKDTPAEEAGLRPGDIIVALDGQAIRNLEDYSVLLFSHKPGDEITLSVKRDGDAMDLRAVLAGKSADG